ncbi:MAG: sugar ABC transporter permease [Clostridiaceae bacterium]|nr:sugar ABC transporter permease [Clostridiaceae bacterium]
MSKPSNRIGSFMNDQTRVAYFFIMPSMLIFAVFVFVPMIVAFIFSVFDFNIMLDNFKFVGLKHFFTAFGEKRVWNAMYNTTYYTIFHVILQVTLSLIIAVLIKDKSKFNVFLRGTYFLPVVCSMTVVSLVWMFLLDSNIGAIALYLRQFGINAKFLDDPNQAMPVVILVSVWKSFGFSMVIFLAAVQAIPESYYEAADIDGINNFQKLMKITIPLIMPTLGFVTINSVIGSFQVFDQIFVMTDGGPIYRTETMVHFIYNVAFKDLKLGYASALSVILFLVILVVSLITFKRTSTDKNIY